MRRASATSLLTNTDGVLAASGAETEAHGIGQCLLPFRLSLCPASLPARIRCSGVQHCASQRRQKQGEGCLCPQEAHCTKPESLDSHRGREGLWAHRGGVYFAQGMVPCGIEGLPRGGGKHTNCIPSPLWETFLSTQQGPHALPRRAVLRPDQIWLLPLVSEPCITWPQTVRVCGTSIFYIPLGGSEVWGIPFSASSPFGQALN